MLWNESQSSMSGLSTSMVEMLDPPSSTKLNWRIALISLINTITFQFKDQRFLPSSLYQSKQGQPLQPPAVQYDLPWVPTMVSEPCGCCYCLQWPNVCWPSHRWHRDRVIPSRSRIWHAHWRAEEGRYSDRCIRTLSCAMFIPQSDHRQYRKLSEDLENSFT